MLYRPFVIFDEPSGDQQGSGFSQTDLDVPLLRAIPNKPKTGALRICLAPIRGPLSA
jgi:hypothetical protein